MGGPTFQGVLLLLTNTLLTHCKTSIKHEYLCICMQDHESVVSYMEETKPRDMRRPFSSHTLVFITLLWEEKL